MSNSVFAETKYFIIDMDGTFYLDGNIIPGSVDFLNTVKQKGKDFLFYTNNSSNNVEVCRTRLHNMGYDISPYKIVISSHVTIDFLKANRNGKRVYLLGNERLTADFVNAGIILDDKDPDIVVLGFDTTLTYEKLRRACRFLAEGKEYIATHPDFNCPTADGFMPDTGSMMALFEASTGRKPDMIMGKPHKYTVDYLTRLLSCKKEELWLVKGACDFAVKAITITYFLVCKAYHITKNNRQAANCALPVVFLLQNYTDKPVAALVYNSFERLLKLHSRV
mgnify:CR=1 FL=1